MASKDRAGYRKEIACKLKESDPQTWAALTDWAREIGGIARQVADDYEEAHSNLEDMPGLLAGWEEKNQEAMDGWIEVADALEDYEAEDPPELEAEDDKESYWERVEIWLEERAEAIREQVGQVLP